MNYEPLIGDVITFEDKKTGIRGTCVIARIEGLMFRSSPGGQHFHGSHDLIFKAVRKVGNKHKVVFEPPLRG